jgi:putative flippase GtrA
MLISPSGLIAYARTEEAQKKLRYAGVSVVFLPLGQGLIQVLGLWLDDYTTASLLAYAIATVPGFFVYKRFVWRDMSRENLHRQVLVFWATMMLTVSLATLLTYLVQNAVADQTVLVRGAAVFCAQMLGLGIVWVGRYLMLDRWLSAKSQIPDEHSVRTPM